jgi:hypothetical protein
MSEAQTPKPRKLTPEQRARLISSANDKRLRAPITLPRLKCLEPKAEEIPDFLERRKS